MYNVWRQPREMGSGWERKWKLNKTRLELSRLCPFSLSFLFLFFVFFVLFCFVFCFCFLKTRDMESMVFSVFVGYVCVVCDMEHIPRLSTERRVCHRNQSQCL